MRCYLSGVEYGHLQRKCPRAIGALGTSNASQPPLDSDKGQALMQGGGADKEGFIPVKPRNRIRGHKRSFNERQEDVTLNRFEALEDLVQEEGFQEVLQRTVNPLAVEVPGAQPNDSPSLIQSGVQGDQIANFVSSPKPALASTDLVLEASGGPSETGGVISELQAASDLGKQKSLTPGLGLHQKMFKKGALEKPLKVGRKKDQERVKLAGETLVESGAVKTIDTHFSQPFR